MGANKRRQISCCWLLSVLIKYKLALPKAICILIKALPRHLPSILTKAPVKGQPLFLFTVVCVSQHKLCGSARENKAEANLSQSCFLGRRATTSGYTQSALGWLKDVLHGGSMFWRSSRLIKVYGSTQDAETRSVRLRHSFSLKEQKQQDGTH